VLVVEWRVLVGVLVVEWRVLVGVLVVEWRVLREIHWMEGVVVVWKRNWRMMRRMWRIMLKKKHPTGEGAGDRGMQFQGLTVFTHTQRELLRFTYHGCTLL
jgi:hypothetical protein